MNFLDAKNIVDKYVDVSAEGKHGYRLSSLKNTIPEIFDAFKITTAYAFLYNYWTQEEYDALDSLRLLLPMFHPDDYDVELKKCTDILNDKSIFSKWRNKAAIPLAEEKKDALMKQESARLSSTLAQLSQDWDNFIENVQAELKQIRMWFASAEYQEKDIGERKIIMIDSFKKYAERIYMHGNIVMDYDDPEFFLPKDMLEKFLTVPELSDVYVGYEEMIRRL